MSVTDTELRAELSGDRAESDLVSYLEEQAGVALRCVTEYDETGWDVLYNRADLQREEFELVVDEMKLHARAALQENNAPADGGSMMAVSCYESVSVLHLRFADRRSLAVLLDGDATPQIRSFTETCRRQLRETE